MNSVFNPDQFLQTSMDAPLPTVYTPVPTRDYEAIISDLEAVRPKKSDQSPYLRVTFELINCDDVKQKLGRKAEDKLTVSTTLWLDLNDQGGLDVGTNKNVKLGKLREAVGQNRSGQPWAPSMLKGAGPLRIMVTERPDDSDPDVIYNDVKRFTAIR